MLIIVPVGTDAPIYHWPFATLGLIVVNTTIYFMTSPLALPEEQYELVRETLWLQFFAVRTRRDTGIDPSPVPVRSPRVHKHTPGCARAPATAECPSCDATHQPASVVRGRPAVLALGDG